MTCSDQMKPSTRDGPRGVHHQPTFGDVQDGPAADPNGGGQSSLVGSMASTACVWRMPQIMAGLCPRQHQRDDHEIGERMADLIQCNQ